MNQYERPSAPAEILHYLRAMKRRLQLILLPIVLVPSAAIIGLSFVSPVYESSSILLYETRRPFAREMDRMIVQSPEYKLRDTQKLAQIETRLEGRLFLEEVIRKLGMGLTSQALEKLEATRSPGVSLEELKTSVMVGALRENIKVTEIGPDLFKISFTHSNPEMAYVLGEGITKLFVEYVTRGQLADIRAAGTFSEDQLPVYAEKLRKSEEKLRSFRAQMAARSAGAGAVDEKNIERARALKRQVATEIAELDGQRSASREAMKTSYPNAVDPTTLIRGNAIASAYSRVAREEELGVPLLIEGASTSSVMERVGQAREELLARIEEAVQTTLQGSPQALQSLVAEIVYDDYVARSLEVRKKRISSYIAEYSRGLARRPRDEMELRRLEQEVENNREVLQSLRQQLTSSRISEAAQTTNLGVRIEVIEPPSRPLAPTGPRKQRILVLAFLLGPFLGVSLVVLSEYMDDSVKSVEDLTKNLGVAVLGTIPKMPSAAFWHPVKRKRWPYIVAISAVILAAVAHLAREPLLDALGKGQKEIEASASYNPTGKVLTEDEKAGIVDYQ